ncbi:MAG: VanZ family protein [Polaromonas sp.]
MTKHQQQKPISHAMVKWLFWLYVLFVVYGSLVPLAYVHRSLDDAVLAFQNIPFLVLGVESRADWVANGVLYVPLGFFAALLLLQFFKQAPRAVLFAMAAAFSMTLAVAVEFIQLYFPPRTVSQNDILAECMGALVGVALAAKYTDWFHALLESFFSNPPQLKKLALEGYAVAYIAFALFPYDILLSWPELQAKFDSSNWSWWVAGDAPRWWLTGLQLLVEVVLTLPFGLLLARITAPRVSSYGLAIIIGLALGTFVEIAQFFIASGISQGLSVLTRAVGVCCGLAFYKLGAHWAADQIASMLRRYTLPLVAVYLVVFLAINGWLTTHWQGLEGASKQLEQLSFIPFYYHYFTTEAKALFSLAAVCFSYLPVAVLSWAHRRSPRFAMVVSFVLAAGVEIGKLFLPQSHPDLTNLLLASVASWGTVRLIRQLLRQDQKSVQAFSNDAVGTRVSGSTSPTRQSLSIWLLACLVATGVWVLTFPAVPILVGLALAVCAIMVWNRPVWVFALIPAALPVFDLAPWSGRFFLDEFDALMLVCLAVAYSRVPSQRRGQTAVDGLFVLAASLVVLSFVVSALRGMWPLALPDLNAFNNYYSPYNALRIFKGAIWAFLVYRLSRRFVASGIDARRPFCWGMAVGLALTVAVIVWERVVFSGLWNFTDGYRVTGPFSATHTGGAYIDCFLVAAVPFLIALTLEKRHWLVRVAGMLLILATTYALMVTFSRGGYLAFAVAVSIVLLMAALQTKRLLRSGVIVVGLASAMLLVAIPVFEGQFAQARLATVKADLVFRQAHWQDALNIRDPDWATLLFGMGLGRFPEAKYWRSTLDSKPGTYQLENEAGNTYLRLGSGDPIGVEQFVSLQPGKPYVLKLDVRPSRPNAKITVPICEKWLLTSDKCVSPTVDLGKEFGAWRSIEARFTANEFSASPWYRQRPIKLSLSYAVPQSTLDVDNVRLETEGQTDLLRNGDFSRGLDHWLFATADALHAHWRMHSLFYGVLFDQGWFGLVALGGFIGLALGRGAKKAWRGDVVSGAAVAALSGFLVGGIFDTQIDTPRFLLLLLLLAWSCF